MITNEASVLQMQKITNLYSVLLQFSLILPNFTEDLPQLTKKHLPIYQLVA